MFEKMSLVLVLVLVATLGIFGIAMAEDEQEIKGSILLVPSQETEAVSNLIDSQLKGQGLYFTSGGVRPVESKVEMYPTMGDDVILLTQKEEKEEVK